MIVFCECLYKSVFKEAREASYSLIILDKYMFANEALSNWVNTRIPTQDTRRTTPPLNS